MYLEKRQMLNFYLINVFFILMLFYLFKKKNWANICSIASVTLPGETGKGLKKNQGEV